VKQRRKRHSGQLEGQPKGNKGRLKRTGVVAAGVGVRERRLGEVQGALPAAHAWYVRSVAAGSWQVPAPFQVPKDAGASRPSRMSSATSSAMQVMTCARHQARPH